ncbi:MAG: CocE/NonD family hydrolase [Jatrophihabitantaceae bacterium]
MHRARRTVAIAAAGLLVAGLTVATVAPTGAGASAPNPLDAAIAASAGPGHTWSPGSERYGDKITNNLSVRMADGVVLKADVADPTDLKTGQPAVGPFPVLLTITPYGKDTGAAAGQGTNPYFVKRGYIDVVVDVRGTGASGGTFDLFGPKQTTDGVTLVNWAAHLPHSDGKVGMHGASYLGINQLLTAGAVGKNSPLKAIFPQISANDVYRDTAFMGGIPDSSFDILYLGALLPLLGVLNPIVSGLITPASLLAGLTGALGHAGGVANYNASFIAKTFTGGPDAYDNAYWQAKDPANVLQKIVDNGIPAYLIGGEYDLFQRGEPMNYAGLQNAYARRPVGAPMLPGQATTGRYQLLDGPFTHLSAAIGAPLGPDLNDLQLEWFDTWLKGASTGMATTPTPLHYYDLGTGDYTETTTYPFTGAVPTTYYFDGARSDSAPSQNDGSLSTARPTATAGADTLLWSPVGPSICDRSQDQWSMGALSLALGKLADAAPCLADDRAAQVGPTALTYTTAPMTRPSTIAGPITATIYAAANTSETQWVVNVEDVAPTGSSKPLTEGALLGSFRAVNTAKSWTVDGKTIMPYHDYTKASAHAVPKGAVTEYQVEVFPTYSGIAAGHRIRVTLSTTDFPHLTATTPALLKLIGGVYQVQRTASAPSSVTIPVIAR